MYEDGISLYNYEEEASRWKEVKIKDLSGGDNSPL